MAKIPAPALVSCNQSSWVKDQEMFTLNYYVSLAGLNGVNMY
jgi:hypothetical protein